LINGLEESDQIPRETKPPIAPGIAEAYFRVESEIRESPQVAYPERETGRDISGCDTVVPLPNTNRTGSGPTFRHSIGSSRFSMRDGIPAGATRSGCETLLACM
jgi:hypothetical protein